MYFPLGWPKILCQSKDEKSYMKFISCNRYRMLFVVLTEETVSIWHCRPLVEILHYKRSQSSIEKAGKNEIAEWRHDSSMLALVTNTGFLLIFRLEQDIKSETGINLYEYRQNKSAHSENSDGIPALRLCLKASIQYSSTITSLSCINDDILISTSNGELELIPWLEIPSARKLVNIQDIPFSVDFQSAGSALRSKHTTFINQLTYSPCLDGFTAVFNDGRAALVVVSNTSIEKEKNVSWKCHGIWAPGLTKAVCNAVNNRYRLMAFGTSRGSCEVFSLDDVSGSLQFSHQMALTPKYYPDVYRNTGSVLDMKWSPDGCALAMSWSNGGFSLWSVYGACLLCTLNTDHAFTAEGCRKEQSLFYSMCWGAEGYQLWILQKHHTELHKSSSTKDFSLVYCDKCDMVTRNHSVCKSGYDLLGSTSSLSDDGFIEPVELSEKTESDNEQSNASSSHSDVFCPVSNELVQMQFAKTALTMNPCRGNHSHIILQAEDRIISSFGDKNNAMPSSIKPTNLDFNLLSSSQQSTLKTPDRTFENVVGNKQWNVMQMPLNYLNGNWPIRFTSIDKAGQLLAIAGNFGLAHYSLVTKKWKLFGNVMQEKDMVVTGGLTWWRGLIIVACFNLVSTQDELRIYPNNTNLDNVFSYTKKVHSQVLLINVYMDTLITFDAACYIRLYRIEPDDKIQYQSARLSVIREISMARFVSFPSLVISVTMASLHMDSGGRKHSSLEQETEVLIINVAGRLLLLQPSLGEYGNQGENASVNLSFSKDMNFHPPIVLASSVENVWTTELKNSQKVHLTDALWLGCGSAGLRVWLPLFPPSRRAQTGGIGEHDIQVLLSKRITVTLEVDTCYPLTVLFENAVVLGAKTESFHYQKTLANGNSSFLSVERSCEIYLHQIVRQLLRRNLGYHALQVAASCKSHSYFPHVLELMLHKVLEEEATASEPIPDPFLPTIVKFIAEFPEYLETIVHCARKTEIALWQYLFSYVGNPKELFEECLEAGQLQTAASYLIILQNLEKLAVARQDATRLLNKALNAFMWLLAADIIRFLRAIGDGDATTSPRHPVLLNRNIYPAPASHLSLEESTKFSENIAPRDRSATSSVSSALQSRNIGGRSRRNYFERPTVLNTTQNAEYSASFHPYVSQYPVKKSYPHHRILQASLSYPPAHEVSQANEKSNNENAKMLILPEESLNAECAEHFFIDVILSRQARKLLSQRKMKELATFAAHMDFALVPWLQKEKNRAARVSDPVKCLCMLHSNFNIPYPEAKKETSDKHFVQRNSNSTHHDESCDSVAEEISIRYKADKGREFSRTKEQLMYLFRILLESSCLELAMLVCIVLRKLSLLSEFITYVCSGEGIQLTLLQRTRECVVQIKKWAVTDGKCYDPVLSSMKNHFLKFNEIVNSHEVDFAEKQAVFAQQKAAMDNSFKSVSSDVEESSLARLKLSDYAEDDCPAFTEESENNISDDLSHKSSVLIEPSNNNSSANETNESFNSERVEEGSDACRIV